jgi:predicted ester cyclase
MSIADNKAIVRRIHDQLNHGHFEIVDELYAPNYVSHTRDLLGYKADLASHRTAFPDWHTTIESLLGEGDIVISRVSERGTQRGERKPPNGSSQADAPSCGIDAGYHSAHQELESRGIVDRRGPLGHAAIKLTRSGRRTDGLEQHAKRPLATE